MNRYHAYLSWLMICWATAAHADLITPFTGMSPGDVAAPWQLLTISSRPPAAFRIIDDDGGVVEAVANSSVASLFHALHVDPNVAPALTWRWRVLNGVAGSDLYSKSGDDYPARVYVMFDYDTRRLPFRARWQLRLARLIYGPWVPGAALCYVPANGINVETIAPNAYSDRVQMIVVADEGNRDGGRWQSFTRNISADYEAAFGEPAPLVVGVAIAIDTDDTGESASALFGDLKLTAIDSP